VWRKGRSRIEQQWDCCYDIDLKESLTQLFSNEAIRTKVGAQAFADLWSFNEDMNVHVIQISQRRNLQPGTTGDYCDGPAFQNHPLYKDHPEALQIQLYYDDLEVCNPLGSKVNKHKLALFYYVLGNIPPEHRSTLSAIQLLTVVKSQFLVKYGIDKILQPTIEAVAQLEQVRSHTNYNA
jgi:hypothetical protein